MTHTEVYIRHEGASRSVRGESERRRESSGNGSRCARGDAETRQAFPNIGTPGTSLRGAGSRPWRGRRSAALQRFHDSTSPRTHRAFERLREAERSHAQFDRLSIRRGVPRQNTRRPAPWPWTIGGSISNTRLTAWPTCCSARPMVSLSQNVARLPREA